MPKKGVHDMGGNPAGPIDRHEHVPTLTERRIDAMMQLLRAKPRAFWKTDENRRTIESLAPETYNTAGYYQKWAYAMRGLLVEKGILSDTEIDARLAAVKARHRNVKAAGKAPRQKAPAAASARRTATVAAEKAPSKAARVGAGKPRTRKAKAP